LDRAVLEINPLLIYKIKDYSNLMEKKPLILITNDDGLDARGIYHLWRALHPIAETVIIAPSTEKSCSGVSLTLYHPLQIHSAPWEENVQAWKVTGTPADCVRLGVPEILGKNPDLIASGINHGSNAGQTVLYSGTIGGVIEGIHRNIQGVAFSLMEETNPSFEHCYSYIQKTVRYLLANPLPMGTLLNVNFPTASKGIQGMKLGSQGRSRFIENPVKRQHPEGQTYYWLGGKWDCVEETEHSDVAHLEQGFATAVPIKVDQLTHFSFLQERKENFENFFS
jgi:5'-nucleotidase